MRARSSEDASYADGALTSQPVEQLRVAYLGEHMTIVKFAKTAAPC